MVALAIVGTFPTVACALVGVAYQILRLDLFGAAGPVILGLAALATIAAAAVVWRHPEGLAHRPPEPELDIRKARAIESEDVAWDKRGAHLQRAVDHYLAAMDGSSRGSLTWLDAAFGAGALLAGENAVRDLDRAVPLLESVIGSVEGYHPAYYYLGEARVMRHDFDEAERVWRRGLALDPTQTAIADVLARLPEDRQHKPTRRRTSPS